MSGLWGAAAVVAGYVPATRTWAAAGEGGEGTIDIPSLDGELVFSGAVFDESSDDFGHIVSHTPHAVLIPGSVHDIKKLVRFARRHGLEVGGMSMVGNTHSNLGQSQVEAGVVVDMAALAEVHEINAEDALVDAGVRWLDLLEQTLPLGKSPPTLTDYLDLSVGGTLSVGGIGGQVGHDGLLLDNVVELQVVTGSGKVRWCSPTHRKGLFDAVRGGLGQFGIIVKARVRLRQVPANARTYHVLYDDLATYMSDQELALNDGRFDYLEGFAVPNEEGSGWLYQFEGVAYFADGDPPDDDALLGDLSYMPDSESSSDSSYFDFANRLAPTVQFLMDIGVWGFPHPWIDMLIPASEAPSYVADVLSQTTVDNMGQGPILLYPLKRSKITAPFFALPDEETCYLFSLLRTAVPPTPERSAELLELNRGVYEQGHAIGGKRYAIGAVPFSASDWHDHFGARWPDLVHAKAAYDPDNVLTPGQGIF